MQQLHIRHRLKLNFSGDPLKIVEYFLVVKMPSPLKCLRTWKFFHRFRSSPTPSSSSEPEISLGMQDDDDKLQEAFIPVEELKNILDEKPDAVLLVDCRAVEEYERKRIRHFNSCISIPVANLVPG